MWALHFFIISLGSYQEKMYLCKNKLIILKNMATIYLDNTTYNEAALYAKIHNISISEAIKAGMKALMNNIKTNSQDATSEKYYISPKVKALESGFICPKDLSFDYKKELSDSAIKKYL